MAAELHFAENPLALHLLLERFEGLVDVIVTNENLHAGVPLQKRVKGAEGKNHRRCRGVYQKLLGKSTGGGAGSGCFVGGG